MKVLLIPKYCDPNSILLVNPNGCIKRLFCPFRVKSTEESTGFKSGTWLWVTEVSPTTEDDLIFWIYDRAYSYRGFEITVEF